MDNENQGLSLATIAGLDTSDIEELRSSQLPAGLYDFEVTETKLEQVTVNKDGTDELRFKPSIVCKVIGVDTIVESGVKEEEVLGKTYTESFFIDPAEAEKGIGYLKGFVTDIGGDSKGKVGGLPEAERGSDYEPGYLDKLVGHRFKSKIVKKKGRDGEFYSRLQLVKQRS